MWNKRWLVPLILVAVLVLGLVYVWLSPIFALRGLQRAIQTKNPSAVERYVDFPKVRESLKSELNRALMAEAEKDTSGFGALGLLFVGPLVDRLVDAYVTPEGLASVGTGQSPERGDVEAVANWRVQRRGFSEAFISTNDNPNDGLIMQRQGLGWKVVRLQIDLDRTE